MSLVSQQSIACMPSLLVSQCKQATTFTSGPGCSRSSAWSWEGDWTIGKVSFTLPNGEYHGKEDSLKGMGELSCATLPAFHQSGRFNAPKWFRICIAHTPRHSCCLCGWQAVLDILMDTGWHRYG